MPFFETRNSKLETRNCWKGYTLIEFLIVLGILAIVVGSTLLFLTSILKGSNQANITSEVKQTGQTVLDTLDQQIRGAQDARSLTSDELSQAGTLAKAGVVLTLLGNKSLWVTCFNSNTTSLQNGWIGISTLDTGTTPTLSNYSPVTNTDPITGVNIEDYPACNISAIPVSPGGFNAPVVSIEFRISQGLKAPSRQDYVASSQFKTTVSLRKYK